ETRAKVRQSNPRSPSLSSTHNYHHVCRHPPENTPMTYRASTSANLDPVISSAFIKANYEALESLLRDRRAQSRAESKVERNTEGRRPLEKAPRGNEALKLSHANSTGKPPCGGNSCPSPIGGARTIDLRK
nr:reverse transcriptase domain-containing protein [Tanacetum cinerariifolium]